MRLKRLELFGFKSFPARTEIVFGEGITGIVGPNGSGKSNIADAVRWVLGEQSAKTLRGASMSDVIFNGTQKRKPQSYCEVALVFDNEDHALTVDFTEVMVTRRVYRTGESNYFINGSSCRLKDVLDLFRDTGIGREGYSIIGQGRIDEILSRKSEDRRQVFEEAAGITKFRVRKEEADRKLQRTLENAARVDDILEELSRQLAPLEEQSRTARRYLALFEEMKTLDLGLFMLRSDKLEQRLKDLAAELERLQKVLNDTDAEIAEKNLARDLCQEKIAALDAQIGKARDEIMAGAEEIHAQQQERSALQNRMDNREANRQRLEGESASARRRLADIANLLNTGTADTEEKQKEAAQAEAALAGAREKERLAAQAETEAEIALETHKEAVIQAMNRSSALQNDRTRLTAMREQMTLRLTELEGTHRSMQAESERLRDALNDQQEKLAEENSLLAQRQQSHRLETGRLEEADADLIRIRAEAEKLSAKLQSDQTRWRLLDEMTREMEGYSQSVRRAVQYARERKNPGVKGVLAQLISVPREVETAIDMALGAAQQNIVTDTQETAKDIIAYLRENRLGRATFLPMDAVKSKTLTQQERGVLSMTGCIGVASDLIRCAPEYRGIVENLLGRTVIADSLDHGIPIMNAGRHAFRLVTLAGDVMHSGGSMTGGSAQSRMVNLLSRERELKELTETLRKGKTELDGLKQTLQDTQERKNRLKEAVAAALEEMHQQEIAVARETEHTENARAALEAAAGREEEIGLATEQLTDQIADIDGQLTALSQERSEPYDEEAMAAKTEQLQQALSQQRIIREQCASDVMNLTIQLSDLNHAIDVMQRDAKRNEADRDQLLQDEENRSLQRAEMARLDAEDRIAAAETDGRIEALRRVQQQREDSVRAVEADRVSEQLFLSDLLRTIEEKHLQHTADSDAMHRTEMASGRASAELKAMQDRVWNTYELTYAGAENFRPGPDFRERDADRQVKELSAEIKGLGSVNIHAVEQYTETKARYDDLSAQQADLRKAEEDLNALIERLLSEMKVTFTANFSLMQTYFSETFNRLFGGGKAELVLSDPDDPLNCGIEINAQPPGKKLQLLSLLSGGERALTAIAILFAMLKLKPTPFCILDEIEAALDDANIGYYADYLREYSRDTQFIVITHRKGTMERCNSLYGVSMEEQGVSKIVSVSLQDYGE